ncbi:DinB family protein [Nocardioides panacisoli]|uniref:mycothiol transferase n=1 Tax=Nocardioides panacisoli TaxID=627624 RepID=UPI001C633CA8|nr:DUF664 domain-containing protein [Nocardioides panacisoli]QYJ03343.1 DinB family protein [Nocardioides panacisoli]
MTPAELLIDAVGRVRQGVDAVLDGISEDQLHHRVGPDANPIGWLVWHLTRVQDDHVADVAGREQVWTAERYADRFALPYDVADIGFGHSSDEVALLRAPEGLLREYHHATHDRTVAYLRSVAGDDLDRVVDAAWDPPVTLGVRLVSVVNDTTQHVGQAAYLRGLLSG